MQHYDLYMYKYFRWLERSTYGKCIILRLAVMLFMLSRCSTVINVYVIVFHFM